MHALYKRKRGRAPNNANGVPMRWDTATGEWYDVEANAPPAVQERVHQEEQSEAQVASKTDAAFKALAAERDAANQKLQELQKELLASKEALNDWKLKAVERNKALQLMMIAQRPDMGVNILGVHPSSRLSWWNNVSPDTFTVLNDCFQASLIGHKKFGANTICARPQLFVHKIAQHFNPKGAAEYNQLLLTKHPVAVSSEFVRYPWQRINTLGDAHNEIFAWHGTKTTASERSLEQEGFDLRRVRVDKGLFGDGLYFSPHASKSDMYTKPWPASDKTAPKSIYLVRLNMGRVCDVTTSDKGRRVPPDQYDTVRAGGHATLNDEYVLFDNHRVHIAFKFSYTHAAACQCAMCIAY